LVATYLPAAQSKMLGGRGTVTEGAEVAVTKRAGSRDWDMGGLHLAIYTREAAPGTVIILLQERISLPVAINKTVESITPWSAKDLPKRYRIYS
jgi:hypothetical protein